MNKEEKKYSGYHGSYVWPVFLIGLGVVFLLKNLGVFEFDTWEMVWRLWPLILVGMGLDSLLRHQGIASPTFFIGFGLILLMDNYSLLSINPWDLLFRYWPLLIVAVGIDVMVGRRKLWISVLASAILLAGLFGLLYAGAGNRPETRLQVETIRQPLDGINQADVRVYPIIGDLYLSGLGDTSYLVDANLPGTDFAHPDFNYSDRNGRADVQINGWFSGFFDLSLRPDTRWEVFLADSIPVELDVGIGTGRVEIDLSKIDLSSAEISEGVGKIEITLPESGDYPLEIRQAVGSMIIIVPEGSDVQIEVSKALSSLSLPPGFERNDEYIYSPGFDREGEFIDLRVNQAIGNIVIESAP